MKKVAIAFVLLLLVGAGLLAGGSYWFGTETERQYRFAMEDLLGQYKNDLKLVSETYSRGLFTSKGDALVELAVHIPASVTGGCCEEIKTVRFVVSHEIVHGPLPVSPDSPFEWKPAMGLVKTRLSIAPETRQELKDIALPEGFLLTAHTVFYLEGNGRSRIVLPPFINSFSGVQTDWSGLTANVTFSRDFTSVEGGFDAPGLTVTEETDTAAIRNIVSSFQMSRSTTGMMLSDLSLTIGRIELPTPDGSALYAVEGIGWHFTNRESGPTMASAVTVRFDTFKVDQEGYGPGAFELELRNLDRAACLKFQDEMRDMPQGSTDEATSFLTLRLTELLNATLKHSPAIEIKQFSLATGKGNFKGRAQLGVDGSVVSSLNNPLQLFLGLSLQAELSASEALVNDTVDTILAGEAQNLPEAQLQAAVTERRNKELATLVARNIIVKEEGLYSARASYHKNQLLLNGKPVPIKDFF